MNKAFHFAQRGFLSRAGFVSPDIYGKVVRDNVVRACTDVLVMTRDYRVFLGRRKIHPWPDWYSFGGRIIPGERPEEAAARTAKRDFGIDFPPDRFILLDWVSVVFATRQEPPQENGCHDVSAFHLVLVKDDEVNLVRLEKEEYEESQWFNALDIIGNDNFHPALRRMIGRALSKIRTRTR